MEVMRARSSKHEGFIYEKHPAPAVLPDMEMDIPGLGNAFIHQGEGLSATIVGRNDDPPLGVAVVIVDRTPERGPDQWAGLHVLLEPDEARSFGQTLIDAASQVEQKREAA